MRREEQRASLEQQRAERIAEKTREAREKLRRVAREQSVQDAAAEVSGDPYEGTDDVTDNGADDNESDTEDDYDTEEEGEGSTRERRNRRRSAYTPPKDSVLERELSKFQEAIANRRRFVVTPGRARYPPESTSIACKFNGSPNHWYLEELWKYVWLPFDHYSKLTSIDRVVCPCGCKGCNLKLHGLRWRPMFYFDKIV